MTITNKVSLKSVMGGNTPIADVVDAPTIGAATAGLESATVAYTAAATGGTATSFTAISTPGSVTGTGSSPITVSGLTGGTAYTFKVYGTNASGAWSGVQSAASSSVTPTTTAFASIATTTLSTATATITFSSIPATYTHLQIRGILRGTRAAATVDGTYIFNSDTGSNYAQHELNGNGAAAGATANAPSATSIPISFGIASIPASTATSGIFGTYIIDILDYANTSKYKTARHIGGYDANGSGGIVFVSGLWQSTSAITSITFTPSSASWAQYSSFALYGIKGA